MEVPDIILKFDSLLSPFTAETEDLGGQAAKMSTPGAAISGYNNNNKV